LCSCLPITCLESKNPYDWVTANTTLFNLTYHDMNISLNKSYNSILCTERSNEILSPVGQSIRSQGAAEGQSIRSQGAAEGPNIFPREIIVTPEVA
jgi:hypothetical protein